MTHLSPEHQQRAVDSSRRVLTWGFLGTVPYARALALQRRLRQEVLLGLRQDILIVLEHPPVITLGRSASAEHVLLSQEALARRGVACERVERGGEVTYHGPGQLVGYPIRCVGRAVRAHVDGMSAALQGFLAALEVHSWWDDAAPGLWTSGGKIAAIGVDARGGVTMHGFALNLAPRLADYQMIVPCGSTKPVTSVESLTGRAPPLADAAADIAARLALAYGVPLEAAEEADLAVSG